MYIGILTLFSLLSVLNLTVDDCIRRGLEKNEKLREIERTLDKKISISRFLPYLVLSGGYTMRSRRDIFPFPDTLITSEGKLVILSPKEIPIGALSYPIGRLELTLPIWDASFEARRRLMLSDKRSNQADYKKEVFTLRYSIRELYDRIKLEGQILQSKREWLEELSQELSKIKSQEREGKVLKTEGLRLKTEREQAEAKEREVRNNLSLYQRRLKDLLRIPEGESLKLIDTLSLTPVGFDLDSLKQRALSYHPEILKAEAVLYRAQNNLRYIKNINRFNISLVGELSNRSDILGLEGTFYKIGIEGRVYLLDGGLRKARVSNATYELAEARYQLYKLKRETASEIEENYYQAINLYHSTQAQLRELEYIEENLKVVKLRYKQGLSSLDDVIQAMKKRRDVWEGYYQNLFNYNRIISLFKEIMELGEYGNS